MTCMSRFVAEIPRCAIAHLRFALRAPRNDDTADDTVTLLTPSLRDGPQDRTRNREIPRCAIAHLRFAASRRPGMTLRRHAVAAFNSRSAAARASAVISAPASIR